MKNNLWITLALLFSALNLSAQQPPAFRLEISPDTVLMGNFFVASFVLEEGQGTQFEAPDFQDFEILSGPHYSSNFRMINGKTSQSFSFVYHLRPRDIGSYYIPPASIVVDGQVLETPPTEILVLPNPDQIIQNPDIPGQPGMRDLWDNYPLPWLQEIPSDPGKAEPKKKKITKL